MEKVRVTFKEVARISIRETAFSIEKNGYPETALKFAERLYQFGNTLANFPNKYRLCRFPKLSKRSLHCAVFDRTYIFTYKVVKNKLIIYNVIYSKTFK